MVQELRPIRSVLKEIAQQEITALLITAQPEFATTLAQHFPANWTLQSATNSRSGLQLASKQIPDIVLADAALLSKDKFRLLTDLNPDTSPVIALVSGSDEGTAVECLDAGAVDYVAMSAPPMHILARMRVQLRASLERLSLESEVSSLRTRFDELSDFVENAALGLHWVDAEGMIVWANQAELDLLGYSRDEYIGHHIAEFHADPSAINDILYRLKEKETLHNYEAALRAKDGSLRHVLISSNVRWQDDRFVHTRCFTRDITARKEAERALQQLAAVVENSSDAIYSKDLQGTITSWNAAAERMYGYSAAEAIGQHIGLIMPPDRGTELQSIMQRLADGDQIDHFKTERITKDGRTLSVDLTISPMRDTLGNITGASSIARNITQEQELKRAMRESEQRMHALFENAPNGILLANDDGRYLDANPAICQMLGYTRDEMLNLSVFDIGTTADREQRSSRWQAFIQQGAMKGQFPVRRRDGSLIDSEHRAVANIVPGVHLSIISDISELKHALTRTQELLKSEAEARAAAEQASEVKTKFLAMVSHELRTPLTSIKGFSTTLLQSDITFTPDEQNGFIEIIDDEADKLTELIEQLIDLTRMEARSFTIQPQTVTVPEIIAGSSAQLAMLTTTHGLIVDLPDDLPLVMASRARIGQVLTNLVHNATKYAPPESLIRISAQRDGEFVRLSVLDEGPGITPDDREIVFHAFHQAKDKPQTESRGAGLGLAIARGIIDAHGGRIWVEDTERGAMISFTLPIADV